MIKQNTTIGVILVIYFSASVLWKKKDGLPDPDGSKWIIFNMSAITSNHPCKQGREKAVMDKDQQEAWSLLYMYGHHSHSSHHINKTNWFVHFHSSHLSLSTWGAVSLETKHPSGKKKCIAINA